MDLDLDSLKILLGIKLFAEVFMAPDDPFFFILSLFLFGTDSGISFLLECAHVFLLFLDQESLSSNDLLLSDLLVSSDFFFFNLLCLLLDLMSFTELALFDKLLFDFLQVKVL